MEWPARLADCDTVIICEEAKDGFRFVVRTYRGSQIVCRTYAEAEARAVAYAERAGVNAWYADKDKLKSLAGRIAGRREGVNDITVGPMDAIKRASTDVTPRHHQRATPRMIRNLDDGS